MIILDIHIWVWWVHGSMELGQKRIQWIDDRQEDGLGISSIAVWEVAMLVEYERVQLPCPVKRMGESSYCLSWGRTTSTFP